MVTVNPVLVRAAVMDVIAGAAGLSRKVSLDAGLAVTSCVPTSNCAVMVTVAASVPSCMGTAVRLPVEPAGTTVWAVSPPLANWKAGSVRPESVTTAMVSLTATLVGEMDPRATGQPGGVAAAAVLLMPLKVTPGPVGRPAVTDSVFEVKTLLLSITVTLKEAVPARVGVPDRQSV